MSQKGVFIYLLLLVDDSESLSVIVYQDVLSGRARKKKMVNLYPLVLVRKGTINANLSPHCAQIG